MQAVPANSPFSLRLTNLDAAVSGVPVALLDLVDAIESGVSLRKAIRSILASAGGVTLGAGTPQFTCKNPAGDTTRIVAQTDALGNRTSVSLP